MAILVFSAVLSFWVTFPCRSAEDPPLTAYERFFAEELHGALRTIKGKVPAAELKTAEEFFREGISKQRIASMTVRAFFIGPMELRKRVSDLAVANALPGEGRYVVEQFEFVNYFDPTRKFRSREASDDSVPAWADSFSCVATVFKEEEKVEPDADRFSLALMPKRIPPGESRALRSPGPYWRYALTVGNLTGEGRVLSCRKDDTFVSAVYVRETTEEWVYRLACKFFSGSAEEIRRRLPADMAALLAGDAVVDKVVRGRGSALVREGSIPRGPWAFSLDVAMGAGGDITRFSTVVRYEAAKDDVSLISMVKDEEFAGKQVRMQAVASFVKAYLSGDSTHRQGVWKGELNPILPEVGEFHVIGRLDWHNVTLVSDEIADCTCAIVHRGGVGGGWPKKPVEFSCRVFQDKNGKLWVISEKR